MMSGQMKTLTAIVVLLLNFGAFANPSDGEKSREHQVLVAAQPQVVSKPLIAGQKRYIVRLTDAPVASYRGDANGLEATSPAAVRASNQSLKSTEKLDMTSKSVNHYQRYIEGKQSDFLEKSSVLLG